MEKKKYEKIIISIILIIQTIIFIIVGANKSYIHMDEAYSLGLASYDKVEIQDNENFYNIWHDGKYYEVQAITPQNGVVVRRAADHITDRVYYRQLRHIRINDWKDDEIVHATTLPMTYGARVRRSHERH